jgi:hypothetical protein
VQTGTNLPAQIDIFATDHWRGSRSTQLRTAFRERFCPYDDGPSRNVIEAFLRHHHSQGLSPRRVAIEDLCHPSTLEAHKV